jgi:hypothetical protein
MLLRRLSRLDGLRRHVLRDRVLLQWEMLRGRTGVCNHTGRASVCLGQPWL